MIDEEINRLHFENIVWVIFAILAFLNIVGDNDSINFLKTNNPKYKNESDTIFKKCTVCKIIRSMYKIKSMSCIIISLKCNHMC